MKIQQGIARNASTGAAFQPYVAASRTGGGVWRGVLVNYRSGVEAKTNGWNESVRIRTGYQRPRDGAFPYRPKAAEFVHC